MISYKQDHIACWFWCLAPFVQRNAFEIHPFACMGQQLLLWQISISIIGVDHHLSVHSPVGEHLGCLDFGDYT